MSDTIHSCSPFCMLTACVVQREHLDFEAFANAVNFDVHRLNYGYSNSDTDYAWIGWQAATERAAKLCENKSVGDARDSDEFQVGYNMAVRDCAAAIRQGGTT